MRWYHSAGVLETRLAGTFLTFLTWSFLSARAALAQSAFSADYALQAVSFDAGGYMTTGSEQATCNGSIGSGVTESVSSQVGGESVNPGFVGELYEATGLQLGAASSVVNSGAAFQLTAVVLLDDSTVIGLDAASVGWSVQTGPIMSIGTNGIASTCVVYQNTNAVVSGSWSSFSASLSLMVTNTNFTAWQIQYFGANNSLSAPDSDADGTGQTNLFKYLAGLDPTDQSSRFIVNAAPVEGQPTQQGITFSPLTAGRTYTVQYCTDLDTGNWQNLQNFEQSTVGNSMTIIDENAVEPAKFYRVRISYP